MLASRLRVDIREELQYEDAAKEAVLGPLISCWIVGTATDQDRHHRARQQTRQDGLALTVAKLLARKQQLTERLQEQPSLRERDEMELLLSQINTALNWLDKEQNEASGQRPKLRSDLPYRRRARRS